MLLATLQGPRGPHKKLWGKKSQEQHTSHHARQVQLQLALTTSERQMFSTSLTCANCTWCTSFPSLVCIHSSRELVSGWTPLPHAVRGTLLEDDDQFHFLPAESSCKGSWRKWFLGPALGKQDSWNGKLSKQRKSVQKVQGLQKEWSMSSMSGYFSFFLASVRECIERLTRPRPHGS